MLHNTAAHENEPENGRKNTKLKQNFWQVEVDTHTHYTDSDDKGYKIKLDEKNWKY